MTKRGAAVKQPPRIPILADTSAARGHVVVDIDAFGEFSPRWTIRTSRKEPRPCYRAPGPGKYEVARQGYSVLPGSPMSARPTVSYRTVTSDIDTPPLWMYPQRLPRAIGERKRIYFYDPTDSPGHFFAPKSDTFSRGLRIGKRHRTAGDDNPGPGSYSPALSDAPKICTVGRAKDRILWPPKEGPSPADYTIREPAGPKWRMAIGPIPKRLYTDP